jgi:hypothetical protein
MIKEVDISSSKELPRENVTLMRSYIVPFRGEEAIGWERFRVFTGSLMNSFVSTVYGIVANNEFANGNIKFH